MYISQQVLQAKLLVQIHKYLTFLTVSYNRFLRSCSNVNKLSVPCVRENHI